jgi:hypothetical protein
MPRRERLLSPRPVWFREIERASLSQQSRRAVVGHAAIRWRDTRAFRSPRAPVPRSSCRYPRCWKERSAIISTSVLPGYEAISRRNDWEEHSRRRLVFAPPISGQSLQLYFAVSPSRIYLSPLRSNISTISSPFTSAKPSSASANTLRGIANSIMTS